MVPLPFAAWSFAGSWACLNTLKGVPLRRDPGDQRRHRPGIQGRSIRPVEPISRIWYQFATGFARPAGDETYGRLLGSGGGEVGFVMVRTSPRISWTRDA